jgi:hypothetical protein
MTASFCDYFTRAIVQARSFVTKAIFDSHGLSYLAMEEMRLRQ